MTRWRFVAADEVPVNSEVILDAEIVAFWHDRWAFLRWTRTWTDEQLRNFLAMSQDFNGRRAPTRDVESYRRDAIEALALYGPTAERTVLVAEEN